MHNYANSLIRTYVPIAMGALFSWLLLHDVELPAEAQVMLIGGTTALLQAAYYALARLIEMRWPSWGWLLGRPTAPEYGALAVDDE